MDFIKIGVAIGSGMVRSGLRAIMAFAAALVAGGLSASAATFDRTTLSDGAEAILLSGTIEYGDVETFRALSIKYQDAVILLDSDGGSVAAAIEIGKMIRIAGYPTLVSQDSVCVSACALIWLAGAPRLLSPEGSIGFHASYRNVGGRKEETGVGNALVGHYLTLLNLPQRAVIFATTAPPDKLRWLTAENKTESGIDFEYLERDDRKDDGQAAAKADAKAGGRKVAMPPPVIITSQPAPKVEPGQPVAPQPSVKPTVAELSAYLRGEMAKPETIRNLIVAMKLAKDDYPIMENHLIALSGNKKLWDHISKEVLGAMSATETEGDSFKFGGLLAKSEAKRLYYLGISRMKIEDIKEFVKYNYILSRNLNYKDCNGYFNGGVSDEGLIYRTLSSVRREDLEGFLMLYRRGIEAGLSDHLVDVVLKPEQIDVAGKTYVKLMVDRIMKLPKMDQDRIFAAIDPKDDAEVSDKDACEAQQILYGTMHDMDGALASWKLRDFANSLAR
ncbi:hypothetical protein [Sphingomonas colocasiae]|uniref:Clp protease ClpP n=1 Tax=Sphingomonas colocasiae TaxID=1848973 RepID=A0ABS7PI30_9SPHN|nr:hypothetical protein [Sphingomonas colocasiae]MBY8820908.1 hypothetical protein [Sphingomonas colocasiae]